MADIVVVGGGIAGLTAAALLGKSGRAVTVFEQAERFGGRAGTETTDGFHFNMGPHALYRGGHAQRVLLDMGITIQEPKVGQSGANAVQANAVHSFPTGLGSMLTSSLFPFTGRLEALKFLAGLPRLNPRPLASTTVREWLESTFQDSGVRNLVDALIRVSSYTNAPDEMSAGAAIEQVQLAFREGVTYLNGGWQTLVDRIRQTATTYGITFRTATTVRAVEYASGKACGVRLSDGTFVAASAIVLAIPPNGTKSVLGPSAAPKLNQWIDSAIPVRAACLDLGLCKLPRPERTFALGFDIPIYLSVHSRWANLAPQGSALVHAAKYLPGTGTDPALDRRDLDHFMDLVQPGWKQEVVHQRFLPKMTVTHAVVRAKDGGLAGRPAVDAVDAGDVYLAGDWVGSEGMLADASFASADRAARLILGKQQPMVHSLAV